MMSIPFIRSRGGLYIGRLAATAPLVYFPLNESSGITAVNRGTLGSAANGTYTSVDLANAAGPKVPFKAPYFDGVNDYVNIMSSVLDTGLKGDLGTIACWFKFYDASLWTDTLYHWFIRLDRASNVHKIQLFKNPGNYELTWVYVANSVDVRVYDYTISDTNWHFLAMTWSKDADQMKAYLDGVQTGSTQTGLGTWVAGSLEHANIGVQYLAPTYPHKGWLAHAAIWTRVLTAAEILTLY